MSTSNEETGNQSSVSSRRASHEQLTANTLKSMMKMSSNGCPSGTTSERNSVVVDLSRLSQHYPSGNGSGDVYQNGTNVNSCHDNSAGAGYKSPLLTSQESLTQHQHRVDGGDMNSLNSVSVNSHIGGHGSSSSSNSMTLTLTPSSSSSSLTGSRSSSSEKKGKKVRGFLKKIFN